MVTKKAAWSNVQLHSWFEIQCRADVHRAHEKRLRKVSHTLDNKKPKQFPKPHTKSQKQSFSDSEYLHIKKENNRVLGRLFSIMKQPSKFSAKDGPKKPTNLGSRIKSQKKIQKENKRIAKSISNAEPVVTSKDRQLRDYQKHRELVEKRRERYQMRFRTTGRSPMKMKKVKSRLGLNLNKRSSSAGDATSRKLSSRKKMHPKSVLSSMSSVGSELGDITSVINELDTMSMEFRNKKEPTPRADLMARFATNEGRALGITNTLPLPRVPSAASMPPQVKQNLIKSVVHEIGEPEEIALPESRPGGLDIHQFAAVLQNNIEKTKKEESPEDMSYSQDVTYSADLMTYSQDLNSIDGDKMFGMEDEAEVWRKGEHQKDVERNNMEAGRSLQM